MFDELNPCSCRHGISSSKFSQTKSCSQAVLWIGSGSMLLQAWVQLVKILKDKDMFKSSVVDPVPDLYVFGPPGSGSLVRGTDPDPSIIKQI